MWFQFPFREVRVRDKLACFSKSMSLRLVTKLSSLVPFLLLLVLPLRAQTVSADFTGVCDTSIAPVWPGSGSHIMSGGQIADAGSDRVSTFPTSLHFENTCWRSASLSVAPTCSSEWVRTCERLPSSLLQRSEAEKNGCMPDGVSKTPLPHSNPPAFNRDIYYKNKLEFSLDSGWLPINIPFVFDVFLGDGYIMTDLKYTLVPIIASLRWQMDDVGGPWIFRGNWDLTASGAVTLIPRGPETRYFAWIMGIRRNFVPRRGKIAPYFDGRLGLGDINAKEPAGVLYAQGQDFTFTVNMGSGVRYNFNSRYSISAGLNWMHISNLYLSEPRFSNYGINVYGPMFGIDVLLGKAHRNGSM